ncbi:hypothetical protein SADUNF_Sadunf12G0078900 [Salix dunnii]|uniref:Uncharacterized protein n=1 Tax=Salix dunnii TaxID=1413687 RepID=A0A835JIA0_9ROSI|nr:hypothetical protein SADUNF_Sadunf12G0078900 [Salix dunnii]
MECGKETDPTIERPGKEGKEITDKLYQQLMHLEQEWDSMKQSKTRALRRASTDSKLMVKAHKLLHNSPRDLVCSLQHGRSPPEGEGGAWKVRNNDLAVEEVLKERRAGIESSRGKLKGRRLFGSMGSSVSEMGFGGIEEMICNNMDSLAHESENRSSVFSYDSDDENENVEASKEGLSPFVHSCSSSSSSSYICDGCVERESTEKEGEKVAVASVQDENRVLISDQERYGTNRMVTLGCLTIAFIVCAIGIVSKRSFGGHGVGSEVILFPT